LLGSRDEHRDAEGERGGWPAGVAVHLCETVYPNPKTYLVSLLFPTVAPGLVRISHPLEERCEVWGWRRLVGWFVALLENCQLEAATPGPRIAVFAFWRQRLSGSSLQAEAGPGGPVAASARPPTTDGVELQDSWKVQAPSAPVALRARTSTSGNRRRRLSPLSAVPRLRIRVNLRAHAGWALIPGMVCTV